MYCVRNGWCDVSTRRSARRAVMLLWLLFSFFMPLVLALDMFTRPYDLKGVNCTEMRSHCGFHWSSYSASSCFLEKCLCSISCHVCVCPLVFVCWFVGNISTCMQNVRVNVGKEHTRLQVCVLHITLACASQVRYRKTENDSQIVVALRFW